MTQWISKGVEYKVGDTVVVARVVESLDLNGMGEGVAWENTWVHREKDDSPTVNTMDEYLGLEFVIDSIEPEGVLFEGCESYSYAFPLAALDLVKSAGSN